MDRRANKYTFWQVMCQTDGIIRIPVIQRDYAQGRSSKKVEQVRSNFLNALAQALRDGQPLCLDFVYGAETHSARRITELIDGQQRFTTLYLLHAYFAIKENASRQQREVLRKLCYQVRTSAMAFCQWLPELVWEDVLQEDKPLSEAIQSAVWFSAGWLQDPTVRGMLHMLDAIHTHPYFSTQAALFERLTGDQCPISFHFLTIQDFGDSEDLYIKMNSRGKALTDFENFKAMFGKRLEEKDPQLAQEFWNHVDGDWSQVFWDFICAKYAQKPELTRQQYIYRVDLTMLRYLWLQVAMITWTINRDIPVKQADALIPECFHDHRPDMDFTLIDSTGTMKKGQQLKDWNGQSIGPFLPEALLVLSLRYSRDILALAQELFDSADAPVTLWNDGDTVYSVFPVEAASANAFEGDRILDATHDGYVEKLMVFTLIYWCCLVRTQQLGTPEDPYLKQRLIGYLRALRNGLIRYRSRKRDGWNTDLDRKNAGKVVYDVLQTLLDPTKDCDAHLLQDPCELSRYFDEEREKAACRQLDPSLDSLLGNMEDHPVCKGSVGIFLEDQKLYLSYAHFSELLEAAKYEPLLMTRALLASGTDRQYFRILAGEGDNWHRVKFGTDRDGAWALGLQYPGTLEDNRAVLKTLAVAYAQHRCAGLAQKAALEQIAEAFLQDCRTAGQYGWRYYMVAYPQYFFAQKNELRFAQRTQALPFMPLMNFDPQNPFACKTSAAVRFREDASVNSFLLCAVCAWFAQQGKAPDDSFNAGTVSTLQKGGRLISLAYENDAFLIDSVTVPVQTDQELIQQLLQQLNTI